MSLGVAVKKENKVSKVKGRFLAINRERLLRTQAAMLKRQRPFLDLLPLLFHANDAALPGFISEHTPAGISDYSPSKETLAAAKKIAPTYRHRRKALPRYDVLSIFLMGSCGTIAYSKKSDFDIWLVHRDDIEEEKLGQLRDKAFAIEQWADQTMGLEVHFFLMGPDTLREGRHDELSSESSGSAQHFLLLEEFYRTSLLIGGLYPAWWLVPVEKEHVFSKYIKALKAKRQIREDECVDFGAIPQVPAEEFFGAALWQLYKGIDSPFKSALKLLLMEVYASEYPETDLLCARYKSAVHKGQTDVDRIDPYIMMYQKLEDHLLKSGEPERLDLIRRCFYFKINEKLSFPDTPNSSTWRRQLLRKITHDWGWGEGEWYSLDDRPNWKIEKTLEERRVLVKELTHSYRFLSNFARDNAGLALINQRDLNILGRKIYAAFERKAGKVEIVNRGISSRLEERQLTFCQVIRGDRQESWSVFNKPIAISEDADLKPIKRANTFIELVAWCHFNGLIDKNTFLSVFSQREVVSNKDLVSMAASMEKLLPAANVLKTSLDDLSRQPEVYCSIIFLNLGIDENRGRKAMCVASEKNDVFSFSGLSENLVQTFDQITVTTWKEVLTSHYKGVHGLLKCLSNYMQWSPPSTGRRPPPIQTRCYNSIHSSKIERRIEKVFEDIVRCFYHADTRDARYILSIEQRYFILYLEGDHLTYRGVDNYSELVLYLAAPLPKFSMVVIDDSALTNTLLPIVFKVNRADKIQLFYYSNGSRMEVYVVDEHGSLYSQVVSFSDSVGLLSHYDRFFKKIVHRRKYQEESSLSQSESYEEVEYYQIARIDVERYRIIRRELDKLDKYNKYLEFQVLIEQAKGTSLVFTIYCGDREFSTYEYGTEIYTQVAEHILSLRGSGQRYPIYITDLDISRDMIDQDEIQTIHYLKYKNLIESRLNDALAASDAG